MLQTLSLGENSVETAESGLHQVVRPCNLEKVRTMTEEDRHLTVRAIVRMLVHQIIRQYLVEYVKTERPLVSTTLNRRKKKVAHCVLSSLHKILHARAMRFYTRLSCLKRLGCDCGPESNA